MTFTKIIATAALTGFLFANNSGALQAADISSGLTMKPLHGISFDVGTMRAVSYFLSDNGRCRLVLTLAEEPNWDDLSRFVATRFEAAISGGKASRFHPAEGKTLEFECQADAQSMNVKAVDQFAAGAAR